MNQRFKRQSKLLRKIRTEQLKITQSALAHSAGYETPQFISTIEAGKAAISRPVIFELKARKIDIKPLINAMVNDFREEIEAQFNV